MRISLYKVNPLFLPMDMGTKFSVSNFYNPNSDLLSYYPFSEAKGISLIAVLPVAS